MKKQMLCAAVILSLLVFCSPAYAITPLTLDEAKDLAIQNSREMTKSRITTDKAKYKHYKLEEEYRYSDAPSSANNFASIMADIQQLNNYKATLNSVADAAEIAQINSEISLKDRSAKQAQDKYIAELQQRDSVREQKVDAKDAYEDAKDTLENFEEKLKYDIEQIYTDILLQENKIPTLQYDMSHKKLLFEIEKKRLSMGMSSQGAVDRLLKDYANAEQSLADAKVTLKTLKGNLNDKIGLDFEEDISLNPIQTDLPMETPVYDQIMPKLLKDNIKLLQLQRDIEKKKSDLQDIQNDTNYDNTTYQAELVRLELKEMELQLQDENSRLKQNISNILTSLYTKQKKYSLSRMETDNAKKQFEWDKKRYELGQFAKIKLMQSELSYLNARQVLLTAEYDLFLTKRAIDLVDKGIML